MPACFKGGVSGLVISGQGGCMELCNLVTGRGFIAFRMTIGLSVCCARAISRLPFREIFKIHADHPGLRVRHE